MIKKFFIFAALLSMAMLRAAVTVSPAADLASPEEMPIRIGGGGGMYFFVDSGKLNVDVYAVRPERIGSVPSAVRVVLFSPDREVLADTWFEPFRGKGPKASKLTISGKDLPTGIYAMQVNSVQDPLGMQFQWGFTTDCKKYVIENSRGHQDRRHTEPITICSPEKKGKIYFPVQKKAFSANISRAIPDSVIRILDNTGKSVAEVKADAKGTAAFTMPADKTRTGLFALEFDRFQGIIELDELTRWAKVKHWEDSSDMCHWTNNPDSWFHFGNIRKIIRPFTKKLNIAKECDVEMLLHNYSSGSMTVRLSAEYADGVKPFLKFPKSSISIPPKQSVKAVVKCAAPAPGETFTARIRAANRGISTYSSITVTNSPEKKEKVTLPYVVIPYRNPSDDLPKVVNDQDIPSGEPYFDGNGRAYCNNYFNTWYQENGKWHKAVMAGGQPMPRRTLHSKIGFDHENRPYLLAKHKEVISLLYSNDGGKTFNAAALPVPATYADIEVFTGHNKPKYLPPVVAFFKTSGRTKESFWRETNHMTLLLPEMKDGKIVFSKIVPITKLSIGIAVHSGMAHSVVSVGDKVHIIWGEASDPKDKSIKGVPTYVATYDRTSGKLSKPVLVGFGPPANDTHNTPSIIADSKGYLHAMIGAHGDRFRYARSLKPNSSEAWTPEKKVAEKTNMTYAGLLCDKDDNLYLFYREWPRFNPYGYCAVLALRTKKAMDDKWSDYRVIARPFFTDYSVYYHKVSMAPDQKKIFVSVQYFSTFWFFRNEIITERTLIESSDGAETWSFSPINL